MQQSKKYLSDSETALLCARVREGDLRAVREAWPHFEAFIVGYFVSRKVCLQAGGYEVSDGVNQGYFALFAAMQRHDWERGSFLTYLRYWLRAAIADLMGMGRGGLKRSAYAQKGKLLRFVMVMLQTQGRMPTDEEVRAKCDMGDNWRLLLNAGHLYLPSQEARVREIVPSLVAEEGDDALDSFGNDDGAYALLNEDGSAEESALSDATESRVTDVLERASLSKIERDILNYRFVDGMTLNAIGKLYNLSRERVRQIQEQALNRLRQAYGVAPKHVDGTLEQRRRKSAAQAYRKKKERHAQKAVAQATKAA